MRSRRVLLGLKLHALAALLVLTLVWPGPGPATATGGNSVTSPDTVGDVGQYTSLTLDDNGYPVVSYMDYGSGDLRILHCNDANCAGGDESVTSPDTADYVGYFTSLALDASGYPVVSYRDASHGDLKVLHCNDANCAGGDESIASPDTADNVGGYSSLALDASGYPVISYRYCTGSDVRVMHCNDANCAGGDESITSPDGPATVGFWTSLALDASGCPVVSYHDMDNGDLKLLRCNDANCAGGDESITSPDTDGDVGVTTSLALDGSGYPVVGYHDEGNGDLKVLHCGNVNCTAGNSIASPDTDGDVGRYASLALDASGYPVVSYRDDGNGDLKVLHCGDANCAAGNSITSPDTDGDVGLFTSLALDAEGKPVVGYHDQTNGDLKVLHCGDVDCAPGKIPGDSDGDGCTDAQELGPNASLGGQRDPGSFWDYFDTPDPNATPQRDRMIRVADIVRVLFRYGTDGDPGIDPLSTPAKTGYHTAYDRTYVGPDPWDLGAPDGMIRIGDVVNVLNQYGHDCAE